MTETRKLCAARLLRKALPYLYDYGDENLRRAMPDEELMQFFRELHDSGFNFNDGNETFYFDALCLEAPEVSVQHLSFLPQDLPEGPFTINVRHSRDFDGQYSAPHGFSMAGSVIVNAVSLVEDVTPLPSALESAIDRENEDMERDEEARAATQRGDDGE